MYQQSFLIRCMLSLALQLLSPPECQVFNLHLWESEAEAHICGVILALLRPPSFGHNAIVSEIHDS